MPIKTPPIFHLKHPLVLADIPRLSQVYVILNCYTGILTIAQFTA